VKKGRKNKMAVVFCLRKEASGNGDGDNVVESVGSSRNAKTTNGEKSGKINACNRPEGELRHIERVGGIGLSTEEIDMVMGAKQGRRDKDRES